MSLPYSFRVAQGNPFEPIHSMACFFFTTFYCDCCHTHRCCCCCWYCWSWWWCCCVLFRVVLQLRLLLCAICFFVLSQPSLQFATRYCFFIVWLLWDTTLTCLIYAYRHLFATFRWENRHFNFDHIEHVHSIKLITSNMISCYWFEWRMSKQTRLPFNEQPGQFVWEWEWER